MTSLVELFCEIDDFCQSFLPQYYAQLKANGLRGRIRDGEMYPSEIMTILVMFHQSHYRDFKFFYTEQVKRHHERDFPRLLSYSRFVQLMPSPMPHRLSWPRSTDQSAAAGRARQ